MNMSAMNRAKIVFRKLSYIALIVIIGHIESYAAERHEELYLKAMVHIASRQSVCEILEGAWDKVCELQSTEELNLRKIQSDELHMTLKGFKTGITKRQIRQSDPTALKFLSKLKQVMGKQCQLLKDVQFEVTGVRSDYGKWVVFEIQPIFGKSFSSTKKEEILRIIGECPHVSLVKSIGSWEETVEQKHQLAFQLTQRLQQRGGTLKIEFAEIIHQIDHGKGHGVTRPGVY